VTLHCFFDVFQQYLKLLNINCLPLLLPSFNSCYNGGDIKDPFLVETTVAALLVPWLKFDATTVELLGVIPRLGVDTRLFILDGAALFKVPPMDAMRFMSFAVQTTSKLSSTVVCEHGGHIGSGGVTFVAKFE